MVLQRVVKVLPVLQGSIALFPPAALVPLDLEAVERQQGRRLLVLDLLEVVIETRVGSDSLETHEKGHGQGAGGEDLDVAVSGMADIRVEVQLRLYRTYLLLFIPHRPPNKN
jgi:hypothetical protein